MKNLIRLLILLALIFTNLRLFANTVPEQKGRTNSNGSVEETTVSEAQILRIEFRVSNGASRSFVIGFTEDSTDEWDYGLDGGVITDPHPDDMGTILNGQQYVIQAFAPITPDKEIDLVLHASGLYDYTIISTEISNFSEDQDLFLRDNLTGQHFNLRNPKGYSFNSENGSFTERFQVIFQDPAALSNEEFTNNDALIFINAMEDRLYAKSLTEQATKLIIVNMLGQNAKSYHSINNQDLENGLDVSDLNSGIYMISVLTENNNSIHKKVIVN